MTRPDQFPPTSTLTHEALRAGVGFDALGVCPRLRHRASRKASRIAVYSAGDVTHQDAHADYIDWFIQSSARLREALAPYALAALAAFSLDPAT